MKKKMSKLIFIVGIGVSYGLWNKNILSIVFIMCLLFWVESLIEEGGETKAGFNEMKEKPSKE